jgi:hypothetical protein
MELPLPLFEFSTTASLAVREMRERIGIPHFPHDSRSTIQQPVLLQCCQLLDLVRGSC